MYSRQSFSACRFFVCGGEVPMKKIDFKEKEKTVKTNESVKRTHVGVANKALQFSFIREPARNTRRNSEGVFNETADDTQEELEDDAVFVSEYAVRKTKSRKSHEKREKRTDQMPGEQTRADLQRKRYIVNTTAKRRVVRRDYRRVMEVQRNVGIVRLKKKLIQEKKKKEFENKYLQEPFVVDDRIQYQQKSFLQTEERRPQNFNHETQRRLHKRTEAKNKTIYEFLGDTNRKRESTEYRCSFIKNKLKERLISEKMAKKINIKMPKFSDRLSQVVRNTARAFVKSILTVFGGMSASLIVFVVVAAVLAVVSTSFGIFFSIYDNSDGTKQVAQIVAETNYAFNQKLTSIENSVAHDSIEYHCLPSGGNNMFITNWTDVVAVFSARVSGDKNNALDVVTMDEKREKLLREIFWDMNQLTYYTETIVHYHDEEDDDIEIKLHITLTSKKYSDMYEFYDFTKYQKQSVEEILKPEYAQMLSELIGTMGIVDNNIEINDATLQDILNNLPANISEKRKETVKTAFSLVGKVNYFWGGKSSAIGWDSRWGTLKKVTAAGGSTTGMTIPYGLDCSGFVTWVFINVAGDISYENVIGNGAANQYNRCKKIEWREAQAGDLVFYPDLGHVGIIAGTDENENLLVVHCASSQNTVVVTGLQGFTRIGRPKYFVETQK